MLRSLPSATLLAATLFCLAVQADDLDRLLEISDAGFLPIEGSLSRPAFFHGKELTITPESLIDGWVDNMQCHRHFSAIDSTEILFKQDGIRDIEITRSLHLKRSWFDEISVQLEGVTSQTELCFNSQNRILTLNKSNDQFQLTVGPFYLRYLDGYFPVEVDLVVKYPADLLQLDQIWPEGVDGIETALEPGQIRVKSRFTGRLVLNMLLSKK